MTRYLHHMMYVYLQPTTQIKRGYNYCQEPSTTTLFIRYCINRFHVVESYIAAGLVILWVMIVFLMPLHNHD